MQPLSRFVPRLFSDSIPLSQPLRSFRIPTRPSSSSLGRASSICLQCKVRSQTRLFADSSKPPSKPLDSSIPLPSPPSPSSNTSTNETTPITPDHHEDVGTDLPSTAEERRSAINQRFSHLMDNMQGNIFLASQRINDLTGYSGIEALKSRIVALEKRVQDAQEGVRSSRLKYKTTVADRAATQREVTGLLARKDSWTPLDLERFTSLYRMDHTNEQAVQESATRLAEAEREAEVASGKLSSSILSRYHEEQIWSDKIRRMSTWGTWGLMGVNVLLFLVFQLGFEPWRRKRLVHGFEEKVKEALDKEKEERLAAQSPAEVEKALLQGVLTTSIPESEAGLQRENSPAVDAAVATIEEEPKVTPAVETIQQAEQGDISTTFKRLREPATWKSGVEEVKSGIKDLFSPRFVQMRKQDVTLIALEGAATGGILIAIIATLLRPS